MPNVFEGDRQAAESRFAIVVSRYNDSITGKLLDGAIQTLKEAGASDDAIDVAWVPGAWEIPLIAKRFTDRGIYDAVLCLGAVIKGETTHDEHINRQVSLSLGKLSLDAGIPVLFGVLTCNTIEQAIHRSGGNVGNKGIECAEAALEMVTLLGKIPAGPPEDPRPFESAERQTAVAAENLGLQPSESEDHQPHEPINAVSEEPGNPTPKELVATDSEESADSISKDTADPEPVESSESKSVATRAPNPYAHRSPSPLSLRSPVADDPQESDGGDAKPNLSVQKPAKLAPVRKGTSRKTRRSRARQVVLQLLYEDDLNPQHSMQVSTNFLQRRLLHNTELIAFAEELVAGVRRNRAELDRILNGKLDNWSLSRLAPTDRNVLRLGVYEIVFGGTPGPVAINEAVELARRFGSQHSAQFVNGILDRVLHTPN